MVARSSKTPFSGDIRGLVAGIEDAMIAWLNRSQSSITMMGSPPPLKRLESRDSNTVDLRTLSEHAAGHRPDGVEDG
jgi:hypothetical protein